MALADIPIDVQHAVLAAEDRSFYEHGGVSPLGIGRAIMNNLTGGSTQGGSTITQQYAKNAFLTQERSWDRKVKEALLAFKLETVVSKDEILENYLNTIYFGRGAYGIEAASIAYFGVPVSELDASQGAVLAAIIKSPSGLAPESDPSGLEGRWNYVLDGMVEQGWLTAAGSGRAADFPKIKKVKAKDRLGRPDRVPAHHGRAAAHRPSASTRPRSSEAGCGSRRRSSARRRRPPPRRCGRRARRAERRACASGSPRSGRAPGRSSRSTVARTSSMTRSTTPRGSSRRQDPRSSPSRSPPPRRRRCRSPRCGTATRRRPSTATRSPTTATSPTAR